MDAKEVINSILNIEIVFSLIDGTTKSAYDIASDYNKYREENRYRKKCNYLASKGFLNKYPIPNRKGYSYSLNFDEFICHMGIDLQEYNKEDVIEFLNDKDFKKFIKELPIKKNTYETLSVFITPMLIFYRNKKELDLLNDAYKKRIENYENQIKSYKEQIKKLKKKTRKR